MGSSGEAVTESLAQFLISIKKKHRLIDVFNIMNELIRFGCLALVEECN
jgi:hypothetical protein